MFVMNAANGGVKNIDDKPLTLGVVPVDACGSFLEVRNVGLTNITIAWGVEESYSIDPYTTAVPVLKLNYHALVKPTEAFSRDNFKPGAVRAIGDAVGGALVFKIEFKTP